MTLIQLRYFCEVCKWGSINRAAEELYVTQPAMSKAIRKLEAEIGIPLIVRQSSNKWELTNAGSYLLDSAQKIVNEMTFLEEKMAREFSQAHEIRVGLPPAFAAWILGHLDGPIARLRQKYGDDLRVSMYEISSDWQIKAFQEQKIDLLFCTTYDTRPSFLTTISVQKLELYLCVSRENPLAQKSSVTLSDLRNQPFLVNYDIDSEHGRRVQRMCEQAGIQLDKRYFLRHFQAVKECIRKNRAVCFSWAKLASMEDDEIVAVPLADHNFLGELVIAYDNRYDLRNEIADLIALFLETQQ